MAIEYDQFGIPTLDSLHEMPFADFTESDMENIRAALNNYLLNSIDIEFDFVKEIPRTSAGKYKFVESNIPIEV